MAWEKVGLFEALANAELAEYEEQEGTARRWPSIDGAITETLMRGALMKLQKYPRGVKTYFKHPKTKYTA